MAIWVIADDLTGAAEIGGIALRYGLSVEIVHTCAVSTDKDVQILNTNTRSMGPNEAIAHRRSLFQDIQADVTFSENWDWIYLKFDSALRGHIAAEISFYRRMLRHNSVVFCPVNPALKRFIRDGIYWVDEKPIAETDFARDPEFPIMESNVLEAIGAPHWHLTADVPERAPVDQPVVAAVWDEAGLTRWASTNTTFGIYAGAAAFFDALLRKRIPSFRVDDVAAPVLKSPLLYVCGSNHESSRERIAMLEEEKVVYWRQIGQERELAQDICQKIRRKGSVVFAIAPSEKVPAAVIRDGMAQVLALISQEDILQELVIEGGATARAILEALAIDTLQPVWTYAQGVIRTAVPDTELMVTLKPGSYPWPDDLWAC